MIPVSSCIDDMALFAVVPGEFGRLRVDVHVLVAQGDPGGAGLRPALEGFRVDSLIETRIRIEGVGEIADILPFSRYNDPRSVLYPGLEVATAARNSGAALVGTEGVELGFQLRAESDHPAKFYIIADLDSGSGFTDGDHGESAKSDPFRCPRRGRHAMCAGTPVRACADEGRKSCQLRP